MNDTTKSKFEDKKIGDYEYASERELEIYKQEYLDAEIEAECIFADFLSWYAVNHNSSTYDIFKKINIKAELKDYFKQDINLVNRAKTEFFFTNGIKGRLNATAFRNTINHYIELQKRSI